MGIIRLNQLPEGSGSLSGDDIFVFMDDPAGNRITKKISLSEITEAIGGGNSFNQDLNTFDSPTFNQIIIDSTAYYVMANTDGNTVTSTDGLSWNGPFDLDFYPDHVATNGDRIVVVDDDEIGYTSFSSPSTVTTITATVSGITNIDLNQIIYGGGYFVVAGGGNDGVKTVPVYGYSSDGSDWTFKTVTGSLANTLADDGNEDCIFSDIDYNGIGWNFSVTSGDEESLGVGGGVYTTDITETFTDGEGGNYFGMVPGQQAAWNGNAWYYINSETGSGFNANTDPREGEWDGPYNPWASSQEDLGINITSNISDTFCGGNGYLAFSDSDGHVSFSNDNGQNWTYVTPIPYTAIITNIAYVDNKFQLALSGTHTSHADGEKITISGSSVSGYSGTYYLDDENFLYTDYQLSTPWAPEIDPFSGTATLTWSHGMYIDAMDYVNGYFYIGNDNEQIARSSDLTNWTIVDDRNNAFEYWDDFSGHTSSLSDGDQMIIGNNSISLRKIYGGGENSGDGNGYDTIELIPDSGLYNNNQYLVIDPTAPNHIHIRAGGNIDDSNAELIIGGENSYVKIGAGSNPSITISANNNVWFFGSDGSLSVPASIPTSDPLVSGQVWLDTANNNVLKVSLPTP